MPTDPRSYGLLPQGNFLSNNANMLLALGAGIAGGDDLASGLGQGLRLAIAGRRADQQQQKDILDAQRQAVKDRRSAAQTAAFGRLAQAGGFMDSLGLSEADRTAIASDPQMARSLFGTVLRAKIDARNRQPQILKDAAGRQRFVDTGDLVFPDVESPAPDTFKTPADRIDAEQRLRKEFTKASGEFIKVRDAFGRIQASAADPSAAGDLALIFNYMKVLDPGSTVREGEFANAQNSGGVSDRVRGLYNQVISGARLSAPQRADFVARAEGLFADASAQHQKRARVFTGLAERATLDPRNVTIDLDRPKGAKRFRFNPATGKLEAK